jgi:plasmid rolling circle replication initiator protein Rep
MSLEPTEGSDCYAYLSDLSPRDKPWDDHKVFSERLRQLYEGTECQRLAERVQQCSGYLEFGWIADNETGEVALKLRSARFCRVRHCPICQWRRSLMWTARFLKALPAITADYPTARYLFLTLTVKNCPLEELRSTIAAMNRAWNRLALRKQFPAIGFARATEVTRAKDDLAHPHFHVLMMVEAGYFARGYLSTAEWRELWGSCLRVDYIPVVDVRAVKPNKKHSREDTSSSALIAAGVVEIFKYAVKPSDLVGEGTPDDRAWLVELTHQLHKTRSVALGGVFKNYLAESEPEDLIGEELEGEDLSDISLYFGWREMVQRYIKI